MSKRLLFVCLGNICRSPAAEGVFLHLLAERGCEDAFVVDSAGTGGWHVGSPADSRMQSAAAQRGIALRSRARKLNLEDLQNFDLILTMDNDNLSFVESLKRRSRHQGITADIRPMLSYATETTLLEVPDPYYGGESGFEQVLDLLQDACEGLLADLSSDL